MRVGISGRARQDLLEIYKYLFQHSPPSADRFAAYFDRRLAQLAQHPLIGRERAEIRKGLRSLVIGDYLAFCGVRNTDMTIYRVLHSRMDIDKEIRR